jgi:hypothetical protein
MMNLEIGTELEVDWELPINRGVSGVPGGRLCVIDSTLCGKTATYIYQIEWKDSFDKTTMLGGNNTFERINEGWRS